ncbi:endonuclease/exonuclease/phosphatase family protein [Asticcacaulis taihuensis]|jgi:endonuclease/exonuclease/phosphatase (EEP) superfamily protein YafD|uniref:endonuclease/exonuclease/phosphatase family protein n=1 Tax=Asticcacaulis taihuensis TaxID=260084 RepID=UPI0026EFCE00|nr:endonuclease/exonuclease/phosphatase family protein [Asticcacaulis taihuensis]
MRVITVLRTSWSSLCIGASALSLAGGLICLKTFHYPLLYLIDIFTLPFLTLTVGLTIAFWLIREKTAWRLGAVASGVWLLALAPQAFVTQAPAPDKVPAVRLMFSNLYIYNKTPERLLDWVNEEKPDIIATVENLTDPKYTPTVNRRYPYQYKYRDTVVYSRYPILASHRGDTEYSFDMLDIRTPQGLMHLAVVHLCQPKIETHDCQSSQMMRLREDITADQRPNTVMVGDFNSDLSAYLLQDFAHDMGFRPMAAPIGTWPSVLPGILRIGIDNAFAGKHFSLSRRKVGPDNGSDHRPIVVDIRPAGA